MSETGLEEYKSGLTWRSLLAVLYGLALFAPAAIWVSLVAIGVSFVSAAQIALITVFVEFARYSGRPLTKQEATIVYVVATLIAAGEPLALVYAGWYVHSPIAIMFNIADKVPTWWAPPQGSVAWQLRTLFHPDWLPPLAVYLIVHSLGTLGAFVFATMANEIFIEAERLPFPMQEITARTITVLTEREEAHLGLLSSTALIGAIYGVLLYTLPTIAKAAGYPIALIPIPWADFTRYIEIFMPGASFGVATDIMLLALGLMLPFRLVISMLLGSIARFMIGNWLTVRLGITPWAKHYVSGMSLTVIYQESTLYLWANIIIGMSFAVGLAPLIIRPRVIAGSFKALTGKIGREKERISERILSVRTFIILWIVVGITLAAIYSILDPQFPIWAGLIWEFPFMFILMLITVRVLGETGIVWQFPNARQAFLLSIGYPGITGWFLPLSMHPGVWWTSNFKVCQLTKTSYSSLIKAYFIAMPISLLLGLLYVNVFWAIAPMPSAIYPATYIQWPVQAMYQSIWITRPEEFFKSDVIVYSLISTLGLGILLYKLGLGMVLTGLFTGMATPIASIFTIFLGSLIGKIIATRFNIEWFNRYKQTLAAGLMLGEGIAIMIGAAGAILIRSIQLRPY